MFSETHVYETLVFYVYETHFDFMLFETNFFSKYYLI